MKTKQQLKHEISELMKDLVMNTVRLRRFKAQRDQLNLMAARVEILKSLCHRQGALIQLVDMEDETTKEAA